MASSISFWRVLISAHSPFWRVFEKYGFPHCKSKFKASEWENDFQVDVEGISDEQILHSAVGILRRDIEKLKISVEDYPKSQTTSRLL